MTGYRGLTWDHPRGRTALERAAAEGRGVPGSASLDLRWDVHSLAGFETAPISEIASAYDLIVLDHPHLGDALSAGCLQPLDELFEPTAIQAWRTASIGNCLASYELDGHLWALPLDAASQVSAGRRGRFGTLPTTWDEVGSLSRTCGVALSLEGPHAALTFMSICVALGEEPAEQAAGFVSRETGGAALELMIRLAERAPAGSEALNPIRMLAAMAETEEIDYCPLIFGYVNASVPGPDSSIEFGDAPIMRPGGPRGSTLGGTGLAVTADCRVSRELFDHIAWLMSADAQLGFLPANAGQPSVRAAWTDFEINRASGDFYRETIRTVEHAWVRPRYPGYIAFQTSASRWVRAAVLGQESVEDCLGRIDDEYREGARR